LEYLLFYYGYYLHGKWRRRRNKWIEMADQESERHDIDKRLQSIEQRLSQIESLLLDAGNISIIKEKENIQLPETEIAESNQDGEEGGLESRIGRYVLAWIGNIVYLFGIIFLVQYLMNKEYRFVSILAGLAAAAAIYFLAVYLEKINTHLAFTFKLNAQIILFYIALKLHFFTTNPLLPDKTASLLVLMMIVALQVYFSIHKDLQVFGIMSLFFGVIAAISCDATNITLPLLLVIALGSVIYLIKFGWQPQLIIGIFLVYSAYFLWLIGNPAAGHPAQLLSGHSSGVYYLFGIAAIYSLPVLLRKQDKNLDDLYVSVTFINGILFTVLLLLITLRCYTNDYVKLYAIITICCLIYSTILKSISDWRFASAYYALYGFMAMSISLYGILGFPQVFLLLSLQSLLVVSMALWFRNRLIVIMNSLLFLSILLLYLFSSKSTDSVNFSFAFVAFISARIINWQRSRLQIETDLMRNIYLVTGFFMMMFALYHAVPGQFVTLSWSLTALLYFLLSFVMKNIKYRYLALGTMICAAFYLFIVDLARIEIIYRVLALLFLSVISIGISMYYSNKIRKSDGK
jgi:hypothetical protein